MTPNAAKALAVATRTAGPESSSRPTGIRIKAGALANAATGQVLWSQHPDTERPIGSIVKVMTALVVIRAGHLDQAIMVPKSVVAHLKKQDQPSTAGLIPGDKLTARELLEAMLLPSGCDAAYTLAQAYGPANGPDQHLLLELRRAAVADRALDLVDVGGPDHAGTARHEVRGVRAIVGQASYSLPAGDGHHAYKWRNTNPLIGKYAGAIGIKTGDTKAAGNCLLFEATRDGLTLIGVTLGIPGGDISNTGPVATKVLNWGFKYY
jgi:D-alanyl-D-alanine carboxypeptidase (penicillin-binding protein 5/6)